jgi:hypothetical protein
MPDRASLLEELKDLTHRLFRFPPYRGLVTDPEEKAVMHRIGAVQRRLEESDD